MKKLLNNKNIHIPFIVLIFLIISYFVSSIYFDTDGNWIIATGKYIVENGIPKTNPFTFIKDLQIIVQQWPWTIYIYEIYSHFGNIGLYISCLILFCLNLFVFLKIADIKNADKKISIIFILLLFISNFIYLSIRPTMFTVLLLASEIYILEYYKKTNKKWILSFLVAISFIEINFHAAIWFFHFVFMLPYIVPSIKNPFVLFKDNSIKRLPLFITMIIMAIVGLLNPYGIRGIGYIVYSFGDELKNAGISELGCWQLKSLNGLFIIFTILIISYICTKCKEKNIEIDSASFYLFCGTTIMGFLYARNLIYFVFGLIIIFMELIKNVNFDNFYNWLGNQMKYSCLFGWSIVFVFLILFGKNLIHDVNNPFTETNGTPISAVEYLDKQNIDKSTLKIYTGFNNGGYFELNGYHCYIDARPELYFKKLNKKQDVFKEYKKVMDTKDLKVVQKFLDKYNFDYLCVGAGSSIDFYLQMNDNYKLIIDKSKNDYKFYKNMAVKQN